MYQNDLTLFVFLYLESCSVLDEFINGTKWFGQNVPTAVLELVHKIASVSLALNSDFLGFIAPFSIFSN